jgi:hypothetical protein
VVAGFSKGSQATQRFSLVYDIALPARYVLGCASFTVLNVSVPGLANFSSGFSISNVESRLKKSSFHLACGSLDTYSSDSDPAAQTQGSAKLVLLIIINNWLIKVFRLLSRKLQE